MTYNFYCDESCHLLNDTHKSMVLGSLIIPYERVKSISNDIKNIKTKHGVNEHTELKWVKISPARLALYLELIAYFLDNDNLRFRCIVVPDKSLLRHEKFQRSHDDFYYVLYYLGLKFVMNSKDQYNIYFDRKDDNQSKQLERLSRYLSSRIPISPKQMKMQLILSHESQLMQLSDILTGAVSYKNRDIETSDAKLSIIQALEKRLKTQLDISSPVRAEKLNVFCWTAKTFSDI
jgi:hypothetical protein